MAPFFSLLKYQVLAKPTQTKTIDGVDHEVTLIIVLVVEVYVLCTMFRWGEGVRAKFAPSGEVRMEKKEDRTIAEFTESESRKQYLQSSVSTLVQWHIYTSIEIDALLLRACLAAIPTNPPECSHRV